MCFQPVGIAFTCLTGMGAPIAMITSVLCGSGRRQRPQKAPTVARSRRDTRSDPENDSTCAARRPLSKDPCQSICDEPDYWTGLPTADVAQTSGPMKDGHIGQVSQTNLRLAQVVYRHDRRPGLQRDAADAEPRAPVDLLPLPSDSTHA